MSAKTHSCPVMLSRQILNWFSFEFLISQYVLMLWFNITYRISSMSYSQPEIFFSRFSFSSDGEISSWKHTFLHGGLFIFQPAPASHWLPPCGFVFVNFSRSSIKPLFNCLLCKQPTVGSCIHSKSNFKPTLPCDVNWGRFVEMSAKRDPIKFIFRESTVLGSWHLKPLYAFKSLYM